jgi:hypothetical protein
MSNKNYRSTIYKRAIDVGQITTPLPDDLVKIWRDAEGDEKAITLQNFVNTVDADLGDGDLTISEIVEQVVAELESIVNGYRLISGGIVQWSGVGYVFNVTRATYKIASTDYDTLASSQVTLATADATFDRIDVFAVDTNNDVVVITGTPASSPVKPQVDPATQLELTSVIVTAGSTTPTLTDEIIYSENVEWTGSSSGSGTVNFGSTTAPCSDTVSIEATDVQNNSLTILTDGSDVTIGDFQTLGLTLKQKVALRNNQNIAVSFLNSSASVVSNEVILPIIKTDLTCQFLALALSDFTFTSPTVRAIRFRFIRTGGATVYSGYYLDKIKLEAGINTPIGVSSFLGLSDTPTTYSGQAGKTVAVKSDESGLEFVTGGGGGITGSGTINEIAYFTGASSIGSLTVATYPSLTELSYVKGVTSAIQTQINGKQATIAGTLTDTYVATIVAGVPTWVVPSAGSSNWTVVGSDIYRNSAVAIGRTTIPTNATFAVQSLTATDANKYLQFLNNLGSELLSLQQDGWMRLTGVFAVGTSPVINISALFRSQTDTSGSVGLRVQNQTGTTMFTIDGNSSASFPSTVVGFHRGPLTNFAITAKSQSAGGGPIVFYTFADVLAAQVDNTMNWRSTGGAYFGVQGAPTGRVNIRGTGTTTANTLLLEDSAGTDNVIFVDNGQIRFLRLPVAAAGLAAGSLWNNGGVLNIV